MSLLRIARSLFALALVSYVFILNGVGNDNTLSRVALSLSIVERGELTIDSLHQLTGDKAFIDGHFASDKAPGMSFTALPAVFLGVHTIRLLDPDFGWTAPAGGVQAAPYQWAAIVYLATFSTSMLLTALAVAALFLVACRLGANIHGALFAALAYGLGTPTWGWATIFFGHATSGALLVLAFAGVVLSIPRRGELKSLARLTLAAFAVGASLGWAVVVELPAAPAAAAIGLYALWCSRTLGLGIQLRVVAVASAGMVIALIPFLAYNVALFGSPFELGYGSLVGFDGMQEGLFGIHLPRLWVLYEILFGERRGLLWLTPLLALFPVAWLILYRVGQRSTAWLIAVIASSYFIINSGFVYWEAGWSTGPRYITAALPFICLPFAWLWSNSRSMLRAVAAALLLGSMALAFVAASVDMTTPLDKGPNVVLDYLLPKFYAGDMQAIVFSRLGASGYIAVLPLVCGWFIAGTMVFRAVASFPNDR